jgi:hypothetical protein
MRNSNGPIPNNRQQQPPMNQVPPMNRSATNNMRQQSPPPKAMEMQKVTTVNQRNPSPNFTPTRQTNSNLNNSNLGRSQSPVGTPKRGMSAKQRRFYERLQNHKKKKASSPSPVNNSRVQINRGMEVHYDSQVPEQEKIFDPNKSINLMVQDPYN